MAKFDKGRLPQLLASSKTEDEILAELFLATLSRFPTEAEKHHFASYFDNKKGPKSPAPTTAADTNGEKKDAGQRKGGPRNTEQPEQLARRTAFTDALWALINTREFILNH